MNIHTPNLLLVQLNTLMKRYKKTPENVKCVVFYDARSQKNVIDPDKDAEHFHMCTLDDFVSALLSMPQPDCGKYSLAWDYDFKIVGDNGWWIECDHYHEFRFCEQPSLQKLTSIKPDFHTFFQQSAYIDDDD